MNRFFKFMNAPVMDTIIVRIKEATYSAGISSRILFLKNGVIFRMSAINMKNITKTMKNIIASRTLISVDSLWRFSPKNPPMSVCQTGEIVIVSFHGLSLANCLMSISFKTLSPAGASDSF